jgi:hypothetical protein
MKTFAVAVVILGLAAIPANAQTGGTRHRTDDNKSEQKKPKVDEAAYKAALERIPEPKEKYDPWGVAPCRACEEAEITARPGGDSLSPAVSN